MKPPAGGAISGPLWNYIYIPWTMMAPSLGGSGTISVLWKMGKWRGPMMAPSLGLGLELTIASEADCRRLALPDGMSAKWCRCRCEL